MNKKGKFGVKPLVLAITTLSLGAPLIYAQEIEEIVVTAQFREENLQEIPIAITAVTDEMMRARGQTSVGEITQQAPNVQIKKSAGVSGAAVTAFIRGVGQRDFNFALEPGVGMYIDDVYYPVLTGSNFEILDLERMEVLRGPQGTLAGRNSAGGALRLITKKPTGDGPGFIEATTGSYDRVTLRGAGELSLSDNLSLRVSGASSTEQGYVDIIDFACHQPAVAADLGIGASNTGKSGCKLGTLGGQSYTSGRFSLLWTPNDDFQISLVGDLTNDDSEASAVITTDAPLGLAVGPQYGPWFNTPDGEYYTYETNTDPLSTQTNAAFVAPPINHYVTKGLALTIDYTLSDNLTIKSITSKRAIQNDFATAHDGSPLNGETGFQELEGDSFQQEIRLNGTADIVDYTIGAFYFTQENTNNNRIDLGYVPRFLGPTFDFISHEVADSTSKAIFAHAAWHLTDRFNLTTGLRYSDEEKEQILARFSPAGGPNVYFSLLADTGGFAPPVTFTTDRLDYRVSVDYKWTEDLMSYATYSTGYKSGGVSPRFNSVSHIIPFDVEEVEALEAGVKSSLLDGRLRLNAAVFLNKYKDQQTGYPDSICPQLAPPGNCLAIGNLVDSEYTGFELEASWLPTDQTMVDFSFSQIGAKYTRISPLTLANPNFNASPDAPPGIPEFKASLGIQHAISLANGSTLTPRLDINYESAPDGATFTALMVPELTMANARLTWRSVDDEWEMSAAVTNLTDEYHFIQVFDIRPFGGWVSATPAKPRTWSLSLRRNFF